MRPSEIKLGTLASLAIIMLFLAMALSACGGDPPDAAPMEIDFQWRKIDKSSSENPEIRVSGVPEGTVYFFVEVTDPDMPALPNGGGIVDNDGSGVIKRGTIVGHYIGPNPPYQTVRNYEVKVEALEKDKKIIGVGRKVRRFPPREED